MVFLSSPMCSLYLSCEDSEVGTGTSRLKTDSIDEYAVYSDDVRQSVIVPEWMSPSITWNLVCDVYILFQE
jgi:hypothetical protein